MQTFLPYPDLEASVRALDWRRLGKQRVEAYQILRIFLYPENARGWVNHPAVRMWAGHLDALKRYYNLCVLEWQRRGYRNNMLLYPHQEEPEMPWWFGNPEFHRSHQSNLIRKDPEHYAPLFPDVPGDLPYWWPTEHLSVAA